MIFAQFTLGNSWNFGIMISRLHQGGLLKVWFLFLNSSNWQQAHKLKLYLDLSWFTWVFWLFVGCFGGNPRKCLECQLFEPCSLVLHPKLNGMLNSEVLIHHPECELWIGRLLRSYLWLFALHFLGDNILNFDPSVLF